MHNILCAGVVVFIVYTMIFPAAGMLSSHEPIGYDVALCDSLCRVQ